MNILVAQWYKLSDCYDDDDHDDDHDYVYDGMIHFYNVSFTVLMSALMMSCEEGHLDVAKF